MELDLIYNSYLSTTNSLKKAQMKYYEKNKDKILNTMSNYYKTNAFLEKREEYAKTYYEKNKEIIKQKKREKYALEKLNMI